MRLPASFVWPWLLVLTTGFKASWEAESLLVPGAPVSVTLGVPAAFGFGSNRRIPGATRTRGFGSATPPSDSSGTSADSPTRPYAQGRFEVSLALSQARRRRHRKAKACSRMQQFVFRISVQKKCRSEFGMNSVWKADVMCHKSQTKCKDCDYIVCCTRPRGPRKLDTYCKMLQYINQEDKACEANQHIKGLSKVATDIKDVIDGLANAVWIETTTATETLAIPSTTGMPRQPQQPMADTSTTRNNIPSTTGMPQQPQQPMADTNTTRNNIPATTGVPQQPQQPFGDTSATRNPLAIANVTAPPSEDQVVPIASTTAPAQASSNGEPGGPSPSPTTSKLVPAITSNSGSGTALPSGSPGALVPSPATPTKVPATPSPNSDSSTTRPMLVIDPGPTTVPPSGKPGANTTKLDMRNKSNCDTLLALLADFHAKILTLDTFMDGSRKDRRGFDDDLMDQMVPYAHSVKDFFERMHSVCGVTQKSDATTGPGAATTGSASEGNRSAQTDVGARPRINVTSLRNASAAYVALTRGTYGPTRKVHPRGTKWWRYRWGYTFIESVLLVLCLIPMYPIRLGLRYAGMIAGAKVPGTGLRRVGKARDLYQYPFFSFCLSATTLQVTYFLFQFLGEFTYTYDILSKWVRHLLALRYGEFMVGTIGIVPFSGNDYRRQLLIILHHLFGATILYNLFLLCVVWSYVAAYKEWKEWSRMPTNKRPDGGYRTINQRLASQRCYGQAFQMNEVVLSDDMTAKYLLEFLGYAASGLSYEHFWKSVTLCVFALVIGGISYTFGFALYRMLTPCLLLLGCCVAASYSWLRWLRSRTVTSGSSVGGYGFATIDRVTVAVQCIVFWFFYLHTRVALSDNFFHTNLQDPFYDHVVGPLVEPLGGPAQMPPLLYICVQAVWVVILAAFCTYILRSLVCLLALPPNVSPQDFQAVLQKCMGEPQQQDLEIRSRTVIP